MLFKSKKGKNEASAAAALIAIVAALIVLYILFIPPEERQKILEEVEEGKVHVPKETNLLLSEAPKRLLPPEKKVIKKLYEEE